MRRSVDELADWAIGLPPQLTVVTGGEPLLQQKPLATLVKRLVHAGQRVEIETNGTQISAPELLIRGVLFNVSPKLAHAQLPERSRIVPGALAAFADSGQAIFKFVARTPDDLDEIAVLEERHGLAPIWVMPEGITSEAVIERAGGLAEQVIARGLVAVCSAACPAVGRCTWPLIIHPSEVRHERAANPGVVGRSAGLRPPADLAAGRESVYPRRGTARRV